MDLNHTLDLDEEFNEGTDETQTQTKIVFKDNVLKNEFTISDEELHSLYLSFDIDFNKIHQKYSLWRFQVIHIRGVQDMSSEDILKYFEDFEPNSIEWVNDLSCNVVFGDERSAAIAMKGLTTALVIKMSKHSVNSDLDVEVIDADSISVPIPPQFRWRLGKTFHKSKALLLRFATNKDQKIIGSRPLSQYYAKYGTEDQYERTATPTRKRQYSSDQSNRLTSNIKDSTFDDTKKRFRMRADDEQQLIQNRKNVKNKPNGEDNNGLSISPRKSIWDRLDNDSSGNYCAVDTDLLEVALHNKTDKFRQIWRQRGNPLRSTVSRLQNIKKSEQNDLRTKLRKNSF